MLTLAAAIQAPPADAAPGRYLRLSRQLAAPWPGLQGGGGRFHDALGWPDYGNAMLGYALLQTGTRDHNRRLVRSGLRGLNVATAYLIRPNATRPFHVWPVAAAYNLAKGRLGHWPSARSAMRRWAWWLKHEGVTHLARPKYDNKTLVDAVAALEARRTGLRSRVNSILGGWARRRAGWVIGRHVPARVSQYVLSDPHQGDPIAYHALSYAMYARAVQLLGRRPGWRARATLRELGRTVLEAAAPDGDLAYWGRSMEQKWTLTASAYGLAVTARLAGVSLSFRRRCYSLAKRMLERAEGYGVGRRGEWITPSLRDDFSAGRRSLDHYARATDYAGLALVYLNWTLPLLRHVASPPSGAASAVVGRGAGRFVTVRRGNVWFAVRMAGTWSLRYDFGPVAVKRLEAGKWRDVMPLRPLGRGSVGPLLLTRRGRGLPVGTSIRVAPGGKVVIGGGFQVRHRWYRRDVRFTVEPGPCGVRLSVDARPGDRFVFSAFLRGNRRPDLVQRWRVVNRDQYFWFNPPWSRHWFRRGYHSASDATLTAGGFVVETPTGGQARMTIC